MQILQSTLQTTLQEHLQQRALLKIKETNIAIIIMKESRKKKNTSVYIVEISPPFTARILPYLQQGWREGKKKGKKKTGENCNEEETRKVQNVDNILSVFQLKPTKKQVRKCHKL